MATALLDETTSGGKTLSRLRQYWAENPNDLLGIERQLIANVLPENRRYVAHAINMVKTDIYELKMFRDKEMDLINTETFKYWFPGNDSMEILPWLDTRRDYIYNSHGLRLLRNRYLRQSKETNRYEPIQYCMLRIAKLFTVRDENGIVLDHELWRLMYDTVSCGFMHVSSILADADHADPTIMPGEACRLIVPNPSYDRQFLRQINEVCNLISLGVGVGMSASNVPLNGSKIPGKIRSGFHSFCRKLDSCNYLTIYERKPKIAIYIEMHNDIIYDAFKLRNPLKRHLENVFVGVMIPNHFMTCYKNGEPWYLFPSDATLDGHTLCEYTGDEYAVMYKRFVEAKLYSEVVPSEKLVDSLVTCISETGSPYVIWIDHVNEYSNHKHLGKIKTLNLCAEIANFASPEKSSSCTLMSVNFAMYRDYTEVFKRLQTYAEKYTQFDDQQNYCGLLETKQQFTENTEMCIYAYTMGVISTLALNNFMGKTRKYRELGISPLGVYDMAVLGNADPIEIVGHVSEALYKGCVHSSCKYSQIENIKCEYYTGSPFNYGMPQWMLRNKKPSTDWAKTIEIMKMGMANSQLTAQAPTATTSMLIGVSESVTLPISLLMARESENGRNDLMCYGIMTQFLNSPDKNINLDNSVDCQVGMYAYSAPYIDQSQSTMFSIVLSRQNILNLIMDTYYAKLKTSIYYTQPKQINPTLTIVKNNLKRTTSQAQINGNADINSNDSCNIIKRRPSCDACSA